MKNECACNQCRSYCQVKPGWFTPEQVDGLLEDFGISSILELITKREFAVDWFEKFNGGEDVLILAPNIIGNEGQIQYPAKPGGECFYYDQYSGNCLIHSVKPFECAEYHHSETRETILNRHKEVAGMWSKSNLLLDLKDRIETLPWSMTDYMSGTSEEADNE